MSCHYWKGAPCAFEDRGETKKCQACLQILKAEILHQKDIGGQHFMSVYQFIQRLHTINSQAGTALRSFKIYLNGEPVTFENFDELVKTYKTPPLPGGRSMVIGCLLGYDGGPDSTFSRNARNWLRIFDKINYVDPLSDIKDPQKLLPDYY